MSSKLAPYLNFDGNCREAMEFYKSVLGGTLTISTMGEGMPEGSISDDQKDRVMHADLQNGDLSFFASDTMVGMEYISGNNISISISGEKADQDKLRGYFDGLSQGGHTDVPLEQAPWGDTFGMLTDKYGIHWMVNISAS